MPPSTRATRASTRATAKRPLEETDPNVEQDQPAAKKPATKKAATKKATPEKAATKKVTTKKATGKKATGKKATGKKSTTINPPAEDSNTSNTEPGLVVEAVAEAAPDVAPDVTPEVAPEAAADRDSWVTEASSNAATTRRISKGPNGETFMPCVMPAECHKEISKIPMPSSWIVAIDATPDREMSLGSREWWEDHESWLEKNKTKLKLKPDQWAKKDEAMMKEVTIKEDEGNQDWDFICLTQAPDKDEDEYDEDDEDEEDDEEADKSADKAPDASSKEPKPSVTGKLASLHPDHIRTISMLGQDRTRWWQLEATKRDQDDFDMHIYNDFTGYGRIEVIENIFLHFEKLFKKRNVSYREIWPEVEGFALGMNSDLGGFIMCDDGEKCGVIIEMVGHLLITVVDTLKKQGVFKPGSDIYNLGSMLATWVEWGYGVSDDYGFEDEETSWIYRIVELAEEAGVALRGPTKAFAKMLATMKENKDGKSLKKWKPVAWSTKLKSYKSRYASATSFRGRGHIGGDHYDITKMPAQERKQHSLGGGAPW
ncbi:hypothetical protein QQZ08_005352 [Neonectria magnoliae]|uniref:Uncharacterized protein n=1 Tax=Neonectria magnoliae TaxID=2732573 RepID=A0ABR1I3I4_9HYPO